MDKQFSVRFFTSLLEAVQKLCREYLDFDQCVDVSGYLALEIDNYRKERFVISELLQSTGDVMSESYCTKAFKTQRRYAPNKSDESGVLKERNLGSRLTDEERTSNLSVASSKQTSARNSYSKNASSHTVARGDEAYHSDQSAMSGDYYQCPRQSNSEWNPVIGSVQSLNSPGSVGRTSSNKRSLPSTAELPNAKTLKIENTSTQHSFPTQFSDKSHLSADQSDGDTGDTTAQGSYTDTVHLPSTVQVKEEELDDCVLIDSADEADVRDIHNVLGADDSNSSMYDSSGLQMSFSSPGEGLPGMSDQSSSSHQKLDSANRMLMRRVGSKGCYTSESLNAAVQAVMEKRMSAKDASAHYNIPRATIYDKLPRPTKQQAKTAILTSAEEEELANFIIDRHESGRPLTKIEVLKKVKMLCYTKFDESGDQGSVRSTILQRITEKPPDYFWLSNFCKRHPRVNGLFQTSSHLMEKYAAND